MGGTHGVPHVVAALLALVIGAASGCAAPEEGDPRSELRESVERALSDALERLEAHADSVDRAFKPVPLLTGAEEGALRRYLNPQQLARARSLGVRPRDDEDLRGLVERGSLVELEDTTELWTIRELEHSVPFVTPDVGALLTEMGGRLHAALDTLGLPPFRMEVTSLLRTPESQGELRESNLNAAGGVSTHEFGTTVDVAYGSFAAPAVSAVEVDTGQDAWLDPLVERMASLVAETVAARRSRELQAILGRVILEMQREGKVMATLERQQAVFHMTVASRSEAW